MPSLNLTCVVASLPQNNCSFIFVWAKVASSCDESLEPLAIPSTLARLR